MKYCTGIILALLFTCACTTESDQLPERYAPIYDKYSETSPYQIDIPETEITDVPYEAVQAIQAPEGAAYAAGLGQRVVATPDSLLVVTADRKTIKIIDINTGKQLNTYSFVGRGAGEYEYITNLQLTEESVMIADRHLSIVNLYDHKWNPKEEILLDDLDHTSSGSDIYLLPSRLYYPSATDSAHVIRTSNLAGGSSDTTVSFHKRVIPLGWFPKHYDFVMMDSSPSGELLVSSPVSPFLFLYQSHDLKGLYYLDLPGLEVLHNLTPENAPTRRPNASGSTSRRIHPPPIPFELDERGGRMYPFIDDVLHTGDHILFCYSNWHAKQFFLTVLGRDSNDRWEHQGSYRFFKNSGEQFHIENLSYSEPWLYLNNHFEEEILRVNINELIQR